jgi:hypothetical protein
VAEMNMCFKNWFHKFTPVIPIRGNKIALIFTIGDWPGSENDLDGPPYDSAHVWNFLKSNYPEFIIKRYSDSEVTRKNFLNIISAQLLTMMPDDNLLIYYSGHGTNGIDPSEPDGYREGLYLYDGAFWDDDFTKMLQLIHLGAKVIIILDSCFAHGSTTPKNMHVYGKAKFMHTEEIPEHFKRTKAILKSEEMNYLVLAACGENQTSADTIINGEPCGAFTYFWLKTWDRNYTYKQWIDQTAKLIEKSGQYDQIPNIEGNSDLQKQIIFT